jgi:hypothetical protein
MNPKLILPLLQVIVSTLIVTVSYSQTNQQVFANVNHSKHDAANLSGVAVNLGYLKYLKKKVGWYAEFQSDVHYGNQYLGSTTNGNPLPYNVFVRNSYSGMQLGGGVSYSPVRTVHEFQVRVGPIFRYEINTAASNSGVFYPEATNLSLPVVLLAYNNKIYSFNIGGKANISYNYTINKKLFLGANGFFQVDTGGAMIFGYGLATGIRF